VLGLQRPSRSCFCGRLGGICSFSPHRRAGPSGVRPRPAHCFPSRSSKRALTEAMSLLDALLLDPLRIHAWVAAVRSDGASGSGTRNNRLQARPNRKRDVMATTGHKAHEREPASFRALCPPCLCGEQNPIEAVDHHRDTEDTEESQAPTPHRFPHRYPGPSSMLRPSPASFRTMWTMCWGWRRECARWRHAKRLTD
jgi:hypothetical protein